MSRRPLAVLPVAAAALVAGFASIPGSAQAAGSSPGVVRAPAVAGVPAGQTTFTSPAPKPAALRHVATVTPRTTGTVIYANAGVSCTTETGNGTQASPYCLVQDAVTAAASGDTVDIVGGGGQAVTVTTSNISIVGVGTDVELAPWFAGIDKPAITLDGVTGVTISNLILTSTGAPAVEVIGSSHITVDSSYVNENPGGAAGISALTIDGTSSNITVSRTYLDTGGWSAGAYGVSVAPGASGVTLAGDLVAATGIQATGVSGLNVVGDTIQRGCASAVDVEGTSTAVSIEDDLFEDANPDTDAGLGGYLSQCTAKSQAWAPDVTVATGSAAATTADYNDFASYGADGTTEYGGVSAGAHDTVDTTPVFPVGIRAGEPSDIDAAIVTTSPAVDSANASAPGRTTSDFFGTSPYNSRGALQYLTRNPTLAAALTARVDTARGVTLTVNVTSADLQVNETLDWGDGTSMSISQASVDTWEIPPHEYPKLGTYTITFTISDSQGDAFRSTLIIRTLGTEYTAYGPARVLDTRKGVGTNGATTPVPAGGTIRLLIGGDGGIPADAWAVALNLTVTDAKANGYITAYPDGLTRPTTSNVNFNAGQTVANMAVIAVGSDGYIDLHNTGAGTVDLVADVSGYFSPINTGDGYTSLGPVRFLDTRTGTGTGGVTTPVSSAHPVRLKIAGAHGIPSGVTAVAINLTVAAPSSSGYVTAYPDGGTRPGVSNLNFQAGQVLANAAIVPVDADGSIDLAFTGLGSTRLVADVYGYYSASGASQYVAYAPYRFFDSRHTDKGSQPLPANFYYTLPLAQNTSNVVLPYITGLITNTTVTDTTSNGYLVVFPDNSDGGATRVTIPNTSTLNFLPNQTVPNLTFASPGPDGAVAYYNSSGGGSLQLVVDVYGIFMNS